MFLILFALYGVIIAGLVWLIRKWRVTKSLAIFLSFLTYGFASGLLAVWLWPYDSCVLPNIFGVWLGDWLYLQMIEWFGNPHSPQAHETIPWIFRVPQIHVMASTGWCVLAGWMLQGIYTYSRKP